MIKLTYGIGFAETLVPPVQTDEMQEFLSHRWLHGLQQVFHPHQVNRGFEWLSVPTFPAPPEPQIGTLHFPIWGATRFAHAHFALSSLQLNGESAFVPGAEVKIVYTNSTGGTAYTYLMRIHSITPIFQATDDTTPSYNSGTGPADYYLVTFVDQRFYWRQSASNTTDVTAWGNMLTDLLTQVGASFSIDSIPAEYLTPASFLAQTFSNSTGNAPVSVFLDAIAHSIGARIVVTPATGAVIVQQPSSSTYSALGTIWTTFSTVRLSGGWPNASDGLGAVPAHHALHYYLSPTTSEMAMAELTGDRSDYAASLTEYTGLTNNDLLVARGVALIDDAVFDAEVSPSAARAAYLEKWAIAYYRWQLGLLKGTFAGSYNIAGVGYIDSIYVDHRSSHIVPRTVLFRSTLQSSEGFARPRIHVSTTNISPQVHLVVTGASTGGYFPATLQTWDGSVWNNGDTVWAKEPNGLPLAINARYIANFHTTTEAEVDVYVTQARTTGHVIVTGTEVTPGIWPCQIQIWDSDVGGSGEGAWTESINGHCLEPNGNNLSQGVRYLAEFYQEEIYVAGYGNLSGPIFQTQGNVINHVTPTGVLDEVTGYYPAKLQTWNGTVWVDCGVVKAYQPNLRALFQGYRYLAEYYLTDGAEGPVYATQYVEALSCGLTYDSDQRIQLDYTFMIGRGMAALTTATLSTNYLVSQEDGREIIPAGGTLENTTYGGTLENDMSEPCPLLTVNIGCGLYFDEDNRNAITVDTFYLAGPGLIEYIPKSETCADACATSCGSTVGSCYENCLDNCPDACPQLAVNAGCGLTIDSLTGVLYVDVADLIDVTTGLKVVTTNPDEEPLTCPLIGINLGCGLQVLDTELGYKVTLYTDEIVGDGLQGDEEDPCLIHVKQGCGILADEDGTSVYLPELIDETGASGQFSGLTIFDPTDPEACDILKVKTGCGLQINNSNEVTIHRDAIVGEGLANDASGCKIRVLVGCGIKIDPDSANAVVFDRDDVIGTGLAIDGAAPSCRIKLDKPLNCTPIVTDVVCNGNGTITVTKKWIEGYFDLDDEDICE